MIPEVLAFLQRSMYLTDDELAAIMQDPEQLQALMDVVLDSSDLHEEITAPSA